MHPCCEAGGQSKIGIQIAYKVTTLLKWAAPPGAQWCARDMTTVMGRARPSYCRIHTNASIRSSIGCRAAILTHNACHHRLLS
jgi:hypothetical protein